MKQVEIACDESGSEGENVTQANHQVFTHASVDLTTHEAEALVHELRRRTSSRAAEFKSEHLLRRGDELLPWFLDSDGPLAGRALLELVDKDYFVVGKVVDLLIEEVVHAAGGDLYAGRKARDMAWVLHRQGPRALGAQWPNLLDAFNSLMRARQRKGVKATVGDFFQMVDDVRLRSRRRDVEEVLAFLWQARPHAEKFQNELSDSSILPALDPLFAALAQSVRSWHEIHKAPVRVVHDVQAALTDQRIAVLVGVLAHPTPEFRRSTPPVIVKAIEQADSKHDPRIQVADLLAGVGRVLANDALRGERGPRPALLRPFIDLESIWSDDASWTVLTGRKAVGA